MMQAKSEEQFDIYDGDRNWLGVAPRSEVHAKGLWHQTFQCWIVNRSTGTPQLYLQLRAPNKDLFPSLLDISCAGHLEAGESVEAGVRELEEELGLTARFEDLIPCGMFAEEDVISPTLIDREFCHVFLYEVSKDTEEFVLQAEEVSGLFAVDLQAFARLVQGELTEIPGTGIRSADDGEYREAGMTVTREKLVPHPQAYYELLFGEMTRQGWLVGGYSAGSGVG
ncbi:NUDIX hydrolase [Paenibacillus whitsoniae]|nr:NUDIX domain-containing protein [Paenibacillus whitsoniae]